MWKQQEQRELAGIQVGRLSNGIEWRRLTGALLLVGRYNVAGRTPAFGERLSLCRIGRCRHVGKHHGKYQ